ncbi:hypothetical protein CsSME_00017417 [Camellia sinensis var. sinensis]
MALMASGRDERLLPRRRKHDSENVNKSEPQSTVKEEIEGWEKNVQEELDEVEAYDAGLPNIFKVPSRLRDLEKTDPYTPRLVSVGPYHRYKHKQHEELKEIEKHKKHLLQLVLNRRKNSLGDLNEGNMIVKLLDDAKPCFDKPMLEGFNNIRLLKMLLLDACFILELLHDYANDWKECGGNKNPLYVLCQRGFLPFIRRDLLMLENQLPFSVLFKIYRVFWDSSVSKQTIVGLVLTFFNPVIPGISLKIFPFDDPLHLLNIVHLSLEPTTVEQGSETHILVGSVQEEGRKTVSVHSVTRLRGTGIKFRKKDSSIFTEIEFKKGTLLIPPLLIHGSTRSTFLNLMAFEQCYPDCGRHITSYVSFMDGLIDSSKDVEHLVVKGIISHHLGSDEDVATLINNLRKEMTFYTNKNMSDISEELNKHYKQKLRTWTTTLKREYLKDPWKIISLVVAGLLILLTAVQAAYSMLYQIQQLAGYILPFGFLGVF